MANKFLTEYVFDEERIKDGIVDFKLDVAIRGDIAMCAEKGTHKADHLLYLMGFLLNVPKQIYNYSVNIAKEYFNEEDVDKLSLHLVSRTPLYYLYYAKVLADLESMKLPKDTKKSIFCRYIEDMCNVDIYITKSLLEHVIDSSIIYLEDIARLYLTEVKTEVTEEKQVDDREFMQVIAIIGIYPVTKSPTLTEEKENAFHKFLDKFVKEDTNEEADKTDKAINGFAEYLRSKGADVSVTVIDSDIDEENNNNDATIEDFLNNDLLSDLAQLEEQMKQTNENIVSTINKVNLANALISKLQNAMNEEDVEEQEEKQNNKKFRVVKINKFTGVECDYSDYFDTIDEAEQWKKETESKFPQLVEKFVFQIESK